jgi:hypothetical protein
MITSLQNVRSRIPLTELEVQWDTLITNIIVATLGRFNLETARQLQRTENHTEQFDAATTSPSNAIPSNPSPNGNSSLTANGRSS